MAAGVGTGGTVTFVTSGFSANIINIDWDGIERGEINTSHQGTANNANTYIGTDRYDPGELGVEIQFPQGTFPPMTGANETVTVAIPNGSGGTNSWSADAFAKSYSWSNPDEELQSANIGVKFSGPITVT